MPPKCLRYLYMSHFVRQGLLKVGPRYILAPTDSEVWKQRKLWALLSGIAHLRRFLLVSNEKNLPKEVAGSTLAWDNWNETSGGKLPVLCLRGLGLCSSLLRKQNHTNLDPLKYGGCKNVTYVNVKVSAFGWGRCLLINISVYLHSLLESQEGCTRLLSSHFNHFTVVSGVQQLVMLFTALWARNSDCGGR